MPWAHFLTSFALIFLAAAPGRTTFILATLASQGKLRVIFAGAAAAFFAQSLISVLLGEVLTHLPQPLVEGAAGVLFIFFSYSFWKQSKTPESARVKDGDLSGASVFLIVLMAEFGDVSQLAIAASAAKSSSKLSVFAAAVMALWLLTGIALLLGRGLARSFNPALIQRVASVAFLAIGVGLCVQALL